MTDALRVEGLTKSYGGRRGVVDLTFSVEPGEVFGFLGPNGAGKTTTIRTALDFIRPTGGRVHLLGMDSRRNRAAIHKRVGYLPGELALYDRLTGEEYLSYLGHLRGGTPRARIDQLGERLSVDLSIPTRTLSHGNRQKVGLIQAFMHDPDVVILDEPTQGLDPLVQQEFYALVSEARERGAAVFLSSHVLPEVERVCDRVAVIREGRLVTVEDVGTMQAKFVRTLEFHFASPVPARDFERLPGVREAESYGDVVRCTVAGSLDAVVKEAARHEVVDMTSHEAGLEEIFLRFYSEAPRAE